MNYSSINNNQSFTAVTIKPHPSKWPTKVLDKALKSSFVRDTIAENEKAGVDTLMECVCNRTPDLPNAPVSDSMSFRLKSPRQRTCLNAESVYATYNFDSAAMPIMFHKGVENVSEDIVRQIGKLGESNAKSIEENLADIKKIASEVIYETPKVEKPVERKGFFARLFCL